MTEVKSFTLVNGRADPLGEIRVAQTSLTVAVFILQNFLKVVVINFQIASEISEQIIDSNRAIIVLVKCQESLSNLLEIVAQSDFDILFKLKNTFFHDLNILVFVEFHFLFFGFDLSVFI